MREQVEILIYQYKKQNNLDVYSSLEYNQRKELLNKIENRIDAIEYKVRVIDEERIMPKNV
jgi:hypothetical protein